MKRTRKSNNEVHREIPYEDAKRFYKGKDKGEIDRWILNQELDYENNGDTWDLIMLLQDYIALSWDDLKQLIFKSNEQQIKKEIVRWFKEGKVGDYWAGNVSVCFIQEGLYLIEDQSYLFTYENNSLETRFYISCIYGEYEPVKNLSKKSN